MDQYALFGNPVEHSLSPFIHNSFSALTDQGLFYQAACIPIDNFAPAVKIFIQQGGKGLNVTAPFKCNAFEFADSMSDRARKAKAVNTLKFDASGAAFGDNTDGIGLVRDLQRLQFPIKNARILLLGAGGAARGILNHLFEEGSEHIIIANRTETKGRALAAEFADFGSVEAQSLQKLSGVKFDLVINATSSNIQNEAMLLPRVIFSQQGCAYDLNYSRAKPPFLQWAASAGAQTSDGLGMLIEQAAEAFFIWRAVRPDISSVFNKLFDAGVGGQPFKTISQIKK